MSNVYIEDYTDKIIVYEEFDMIDFDEIPCSKLQNMIDSPADRDLVLSFAERILQEKEAHKYDTYDETRMKELPLPQGRSLGEYEDLIYDFKKQVEEVIDNHRDRMWEHEAKVSRSHIADMVGFEVISILDKDTGNPIHTIDLVDEIMGVLKEHCYGMSRISIATSRNITEGLE